MKCGLVGANLSYSYSKIIHQMIADYEYELFSIPQEDEFIKFISNAEYSGLNITNPYKKTAMKLCDTVSKEALEIGCINTVVRDKAGKLHGYNTDYDGFLFMADYADISFLGEDVFLLGSGGTSLTAAAAIRNAGARSLTTVSRSGAVHYGNMDGIAGQCGILVNTTPVGTYPNNDAELVDLGKLPRCHGVLDVVYNPLSTRLILSAKEKQIPCSGGLPMLVAQAVYASYLFTGKQPEQDTEKNVLHTLILSLCNIVLTGMPGSGKTSIGNLIASRLNRQFLDTDVIIEERSGLTIPEIFQRHGEDAFRKWEREVIADCAKQTGKVIATGGGAMLFEENYKALAQNGRIYCLSRDLSKLPTDGRPLSLTTDLALMYQKRLPFYKKHSHKIISSDGPLESVAENIINEFKANV
ncbi:MAG: shikimate kinase [Christensenellales bacterium]